MHMYIYIYICGFLGMYLGSKTDPVPSVLDVFYCTQRLWFLTIHGMRYIAT